MDRRIKFYINQATSYLTRLVPKRSTIIWLISILLIILWIYSFLTRPAWVEEIRQRNLIYAQEWIASTSWSLDYFGKMYKDAFRENLYYKAIEKWNSSTGVVRDPNLYYYIWRDRININITVDNWTASWAPLSSAPSWIWSINKPLTPDQLFYTTNKLDKCYVSQSEKEHFRSNWRLATDVACWWASAMIYAPDYNNRQFVYSVEYKKFPDTWNTVILHFTDSKVKYFWLIGHVSSAWRKLTTLKTWEWIWFMDLSWITSGYHSHIELYVWEDLDHAEKLSYSSSTRALMNYRQQKLYPYKIWTPIYLTHYDLWDISQNDSEPCRWASGRNLCDMEKAWIKTVAITANVRVAMWLKFWDKIKLEWPCSWTYSVEDEMNSRFRYGCVEREWRCIHWDIPSCWWGIHTITKL